MLKALQDTKGVTKTARDALREQREQSRDSSGLGCGCTPGSSVARAGAQLCGERGARCQHALSFGHGGSAEVAMCLSAQAVPFLRKSSEGGCLVNMQLTGATRKGRSLVSIGTSLPLLT